MRWPCTGWGDVLFFLGKCRMKAGMESAHRLLKNNSLGLQYFVYFSIVGFFLPFFNLYCDHLGFSGYQIGILSAVRSVTLVIFALSWSSIADRKQIRHPIYIACAVASTLAWALFFFTRQFVPMLAVTFLYGVFYSPLISFLETATIEHLGEGRRQYGRLRVWGSISFILTVVVVGRVIERTSVDIILGCILAGSVLLTLSAFYLPKAAGLGKPALFSSQARFLLSRRVLVFLACAVLMLISHGAYYGFFSIHLEDLGFSPFFIGVAWAVAAIAEIFVMVRSETIFRRFEVEKILFFSFVVAAVRWGFLWFATSAAAILLTQVLHAVTYGAFHIASVLYIDQLSPEESKTLGQAVNNSLTYGLGLMIGYFISGGLYENLGGFSLFLFSAVVAVAAAVFFRVMERGSVPKVR
jgi:PPP family 3-phenylpropionic acid transporter